MPFVILAMVAAAISYVPRIGYAQEAQPPALRVEVLPDGLAIDGVLSEPAWQAAEFIDAFKQTDPAEEAPPAGRTVVRVLASPSAIVIGILSEDPDPKGIVSFSVRRDASLNSEDLSGPWESYRVFMALLNWRFRRGDRAEFNTNPTGERLVAPFGVARGVVIPPGSYWWMRYRLDAGTAQKRRFYTQLTWWFGGFYDGNLDQFQWTGSWEPDAALHGGAFRRA